MREVVIAIALIEQADAYLLQLRGDNPEIGAAGLLGCFGGKLEDGESPLSAVKREISEETSINPGTDEFEDLGAVTVISDHKHEAVQVLAHCFRLIVAGKTNVRALEGRLVALPKNQVERSLGKTTNGTRALFEQYVLRKAV